MGPTCKQSCVECHFLIKEDRVHHPPTRWVLNDKEREAVRHGDFSWKNSVFALCCSRGVWDEGYQFDEAQRYQLLVERDRRNFCFFFCHRSGMMLGAAETLERREAETQEASRDRRLTIVGLWIAALALLFGTIQSAGEKFGWW